ncbi:MAG: hypothetical protein IJ170_04245 [Ruminococcus sp.]|nr:hypothetical protein [Ruminococcus sp.]
MTEYEQLSAAIESRIASDPQLRALRKKISQGTATLAESSKYSQLCAQIMGQKLSGQVLGLSDREGVCTQLLHDRYSDVNQVCEQVMRSVDERAGIAMNPRHAAFPAERVQQLAHSLTDPTVPDETIQRRANTGAANVAISFHDDFVDENAAFRSDAGYECYITRVVGGASCPWCSAMAGRYKYPDETPDDIFRRHDNCTCTVTFEQGRFRQDVWSKRSWDAPKTGAGAPPPKVFSKEEADRLEQERLSEYRGLTSGGESGIMESELDSLIRNEDNSEVPDDVKTAISEKTSVIPELLRSRLEQFVSEIVIVEDRGYSSFTPDNRIILDRATASQSILHELGHAWAKMDSLYDDKEFLSVLAEGLEREDWGNVVPYKHPYTGVEVYVLESDKFIVPYQGRIYADIFSVDYSAPIELGCFKEYISVGFDKFFSDPDLLKLRDPKLFNYLEGKIYG